MSFDTHHKLRFSCDGGTDCPEDVHAYLVKTAIEHDLLRFSDLSCEKFSWRQHYNDMGNLSRKFPQTLFTLDMLYDGQFTREYWKAGHYQEAMGRVEFDPFDPEGVLLDSMPLRDPDEVRSRR